ncbi:hypothetical protein G7Y89_g1271 [Cudoniella acicularis]|uniref:Uncharacterized protein n=1 Tax=Cudoniella acicularis TaxID=354080 RepID=A0A8H4W764_9HELO|nr:hypothetical protein G7Y89_g1271 [Cudoniella acicularis]
MNSPPTKASTGDTAQNSSCSVYKTQRHRKQYVNVTKLYYFASRSKAYALDFQHIDDGILGSLKLHSSQVVQGIYARLSKFRGRITQEALKNPGKRYVRNFYLSILQVVQCHLIPHIGVTLPGQFKIGQNHRSKFALACPPRNATWLICGLLRGEQGQTFRRSGEQEMGLRAILALLLPSSSTATLKRNGS